MSGHIAISQGLPQYVSFSSDSQTAYVSVYGNHSVPHIAFIDTATGTVSSSTVPVNNNEPGPSAASPDGVYLYVPNHSMNTTSASDNILDVVDLKTGKVQSVPVLANPHWVAVDKKTGQIYVTNHMSARVKTVMGSFWSTP